MKKFSLLISTLLLTATLAFPLGGFFSPQVAYAVGEENNPSEPAPSKISEVCESLQSGSGIVTGIGVGCDLLGITKSAGETVVKFAGGAILDALGWVSVVVLQFFNLILGLSGVVLNLVVGYTVVHMADNVGAIGVIDNTWQTIRDVANMGFIFILLYASIRLILGIGKDVQRLIVNIIIIAILINFSLFATKVVIDASNVMAITFYGAMAPEALDVGAADLLSLDTDLGKKRGLANSMMEPLRLNSIFDAVNTPALSSNSLIIIGIAGSILALVAAFVFFFISIMLVIRFVVLIFVMILSPLAFASRILPATEKHFNKWWDALSGQAFFAPIYFMLTWIVIQIARGLPTWGGGTLANAFLGKQTTVTVNGVVQQVPTMSIGGVGILMNFIIIIALLIASLTIAKDWSNKAGDGVKGITKWATGAAGTAVGGGAGWVGRASLGRIGKMAADNASLQDAANKERTGSWRTRVGFIDNTKGAAARLALYASKKTRSGSFDPRRASLPTSVVGDAIQGTVGRTRAGRAMGLDDVNIPNIPLGTPLSNTLGAGQGREGGFKERKEESKKRVDERQRKATEEARMVKERADILAGKNAASGTPEYDAMERALSNMSDKEVEAIVEGNKELLDSLAFANSISVKQLEALNKSDKFSEEEKQRIKDARFIDINNAMRAGNPAAQRGAIRGLSDAELEMINPDYIRNTGFVSQMRTAQIDSVNKSNKFTRSQKGDLRNARREPLETAVAAGNLTNVQAALRELGPKEVAALDMNTNHLLNPIMLQAYTQQLLKRMGPELNPADVLILGNAIVAAGGPAAAWVQSPDGRNNGFSS